MTNLLHLPDLAAARPPAAGVARRRGARVVAAAAGGRVKQEEAGTGRGRVIRVTDPVRDGRLPVPAPPPLFSVPMSPASESPAATTRRDDDEEERRRYYLNLGYAIRTLREEIPDVFYKELSFDIYRDDIVVRDPFNKFEGIDNYKKTDLYRIKLLLVELYRLQCCICL
ncbi:hypothetical protein ZWY2020_033242 [Hordeum vulgare]|nr:hypothetical protein ZWY2020_033242 [Hordeum vulgare]